MQWREWAGYLAASAYADHLDIEYNAIREAAALIDVTPLYKYLVSGPDAVRLIDRIITRDASKLQIGDLHRVQRHPRGGRPDRRHAAVQVPRVGARRRAADRPDHHSGRLEAPDRAD